MKSTLLKLLKFLPLLGLFSVADLNARPGAVIHSDPDTVHDWCNKVTLAIPQIKLNPCVEAELTPVAVTSVKGRPIMLREFKPEQQSAARVLVIGGIHGDELTSASIVFRWMELLQKSGGEAAFYHWKVIPVLNPDGLLSKPPRRVNANGVDLNRNSPTLNWRREAPHHWTAKTGRDPRRYPGTAPLSEPESRWLHDEISRFRPDVIVSIHAPFGVLDFDGPPPGATGVEAPTRFGRLHLHRIGVYPGSLGNFGGLKQGIPVVTLELPHALKMPTERELAQVWSDMLKWLRINLVERRPAIVPVAVETSRESTGPSRAAQAARQAADDPWNLCVLPRAVASGACARPLEFWPAAVF